MTTKEKRAYFFSLISSYEYRKLRYGAYLYVSMILLVILYYISYNITGNSFLNILGSGHCRYIPYFFDKEIVITPKQCNLVAFYYLSELAILLIYSLISYKIRDAKNVKVKIIPNFIFILFAAILIQSWVLGNLVRYLDLSRLHEGYIFEHLLVVSSIGFFIIIVGSGALNKIEISKRIVR